ncbi:hypothetical protein [Erythrobacter rubeus]|uniref:Uncharacterized protein n=1 Tax=Erythrobacter rubeus TaxID=2760803 RepID=A0ABR8KMF9_9SPHN|nr:hypothetical protein [Erythrobacter rubeus]MBD2841719.1 hypothetical protein [Erythrobacter rubeus]
MGRSLIRLALQAIGAALIASSVLWALQGLGIVLWPADSFMLSKREWALYGAIASAIGGLFLMIAFRVRR